MATLEGTTIASTYDSLLHVEDNTAGLVATSTDSRVIQDGVGANSALALATDSVRITSTNKLYFNDVGGEYISGDGGGTLSIVGGTEIDLTATAVDLNASGAGTFSGSPLSLASTGDLTLVTTSDISLSAGGGNIEFLDTGVLQFTLDMDGTGGAQVFKLGVDGDDLVFKQYDGTEVMRITDNVRVGIGTTGPDTLLDVEDDVADGSVVTFKNTHSTIDDNDNILALQFSGDASGAEGNFIIFSDSDTSEMGVIKAADATVSVDAYSDYRLKDNISTLTGGLAKVNALNPVTFQYKSDSGDATHEGFIAHEVQEHIPYAVRGVKDAVRDDGSIKAQSFCIYQLIPQLVLAIKELSTSNDALKARIEVLEAA